MKLILIVSMTFLLNSISAQDSIFPKSGSYYRLDNIDSLTKYSLDSIRGELQYYWIDDLTVNKIVYPITIYKSFDSWINDNLFNFVFGDNYSLTYTESSGRLYNLNGKYISKLLFFKREENNFERTIILDSSETVSVKIRNDSIFINNKSFKEDSKGRIFQRFTGY